MGSKTTKSETKYDPAMQGLVTGNVTDAQNLAKSITPYTGQVNAATSPVLNSYFDQAQNIQGTGQPAMSAAQAAVHSALGYTPMQVTAPQGTAASAGQAATYDPSQALGLLGNTAQGQASTINRGDIRNVQVGDFTSMLPKFLNPATDQIVTAGLNDNEHARQVAANADAGKAAAAGAFGNSGFGVARAGTNDAFQRSAGSLAANLRGEAYDKAQSGALNYLGLGLQGDIANQGADLGTATTNANLQSQLSQFNAAQRNANSQAGAGLLSTAGQFNAGQTNNQNQTNAGFQQQSGIANQNAQLQSLLANQTAGLQGNQQQLTGAGLLGDLSNSQVNQALGLTGALGTAGGVQQTLSQSDLDRLSQLYQQNIANQFNGQQVVNGAVGQIPGITNNTQTRTENPGLLGSIGAGLGLAGQIGGLFATGGLSALPSLGASAAPSMAGFGLNLPNLSNFSAAF